MFLGLPEKVAHFPGIDSIGHGARLADDVSIYRVHRDRGYISIGAGAVIHRSVRLVIGEPVGEGVAHLVIGPRSHVNFSAYLSGEGGLELGADVLIGPHVRILSAGHDIDGDQAVIAHEALTFGRIVVGDGAWIGAGATVLQGVNIGRGAVVAAGSIVTSSVPDFAVVAGIPARLLRYRKNFAPPVEESMNAPVDETLVAPVSGILQRVLRRLNIRNLWA